MPSAGSIPWASAPAASSARKNSPLPHPTSSTFDPSATPAAAMMRSCTGVAKSPQSSAHSLAIVLQPSASAMVLLLLVPQVDNAAVEAFLVDQLKPLEHSGKEEARASAHHHRGKELVELIDEALVHSARRES